MGASSQIVSVLASTMSSPTTTAIFADNFFTSLELVRYLRPELQYRDSQGQYHWKAPAQVHQGNGEKGCPS